MTGDVRARTVAIIPIMIAAFYVSTTSANASQSSAVWRGLNAMNVTEDQEVEPCKIKGFPLSG
ncbi:hypothetical protein [Pseudogemmobacter sp. W21_MBD1_M6]|uniref:hypothetical protein n=1 Tax=Pseudogemmobacter sp. W21_MBD1_M6 TaxID=3240271 RepID=UPI003F987B3B